MENVRDKVVLVAGLARSGCAAGALLRRHGAHVIGVDDADLTKVESRWQAEGLVELAPSAFDEVYTGGDWSCLASRTPDSVVLSPGVPMIHPQIAALDQIVPVLGEVEWGSRFFPGTIIAVTGTNGKSTTTELIAHLARDAGWQAEALGNVGRPLCSRADQLGPEALVVLEVSSFQLETIREFRPQVGTVLNLAPDHLDRYPSLQAYYNTKKKLADQLTADGTFVTWTGCAEACSWPTAAKVSLFGDRELDAEVYTDDGCLWIGQVEIRRALLDTSEMSLQSRPNKLNACAAVASLLPLKPDLDAVVAGLRSFQGLAHRQQLVGRLGDVRFVNDSKATNVHAVCACLDGFPGKVVLIAGGRGKGEDYRPLAEVLDSVCAIVVIGEEGPAIADAVTGRVPVEAATTMFEAVELATQLTKPRGTVLLSPACASFDMFPNYGARGQAFVDAARKLGAVEGRIR